MSKRKISVLILILFLAGSVHSIEVSVRDTCEANEEPAFSISKIDGGHIAEPDFYSNQVCIGQIQRVNIDQNCGSDERFMFSMASNTNSHFSIYENEYNYEVCAPRVDTALRNSCSSSETKILSAASNNNSHVAAPSYTDSVFSQEVCLAKRSPTNVTVSLSGFSNPVHSDGSEISPGDTITPPINYPYIVDNQPKGIIGNGQVLQISRPSSDIISVKQESGSGSFILPFSSGGVDEIEDDQNRVTNRDFLNTINPNFRTRGTGTPTVRVIYDSPYAVEGFKDQFGVGRSTFSVQNLGLKGDGVTVNIDAE